MSQFERNEIALIDKKINEKVNPPIIGKVSAVYEHVQPDDDSNFEADVDIDGGTDTEYECPILNPGNNAIDIPEAGDKVILMYMDEEKGKPYVLDTAWTNKDRPPVGKAGMWRRSFASGGSPAGAGDLHVNGYTQYEEEASAFAPGERGKLLASVVQIAKHANGENIDPTRQEDIPAKVEFYDSPVDAEDKSHISIEINNIDGSGSDATWGIKFDIKTGEWQLVGPSGFGIESDGAGNFTWHHKSVNFNEVSGSTGPLSL